MLVTATCAVLAGTVLAAVLLLGRFVVMVTGFFLAGTSLITLQAHLFTNWYGVVLLVAALVMIVAARPRFPRRKRVSP